jgi:hypothetical protein
MSSQMQKNCLGQPSLLTQKAMARHRHLGSLALPKMVQMMEQQDYLGLHR